MSSSDDDTSICHSDEKEDIESFSDQVFLQQQLIQDQSNLLNMFQGFYSNVRSNIHLSNLHLPTVSSSNIQTSNNQPLLGTGGLALASVGQIIPFSSNLLYTEPLLSTTFGSHYIETNLFVNGIIYCNGLERISLVSGAQETVYNDNINNLQHELIKTQQDLIKTQQDCIELAVSHANEILAIEAQHHHHHHHHDHHGHHIHHVHCSNISQSNPPVSGVPPGIGLGSNTVVDISALYLVNNVGLNFGRILPFTASQVNTDPLLSSTEGSHFVENNLYVKGLIYCNGIEQITISSLFPTGAGISSNVQYHTNPVYFADITLDRVRFVSDLNTSNAPPVTLDPPTPSNVLLPNNLYYDNSWTLSRFSGSSNNHDECLGDAAILGNSKILVSSLVSLSSAASKRQRLTGATSMYYNHFGTPHDYEGNAYKTFDPLDVTLFEKDNAEVVVHSQSLNMKTSILKTQCLIEGIVKTSSDVMVVRHLQNAVLQSLRVTPNKQMVSLLVSHNVSCSLCDMDEVRFENSVVNVSVSQRTSVSMFVAHGSHKELGKVACVTSYVFEGCCHDPIGMKHVSKRHGKHRASNLFTLNLLEPDVAAKIHMLHIVMTSTDSQDPVEEAKRVALTLLGKETSIVRSVSRIREDHVNAWSHLWRTSVNLYPKCSADAGQKQLAAAYKKHLRLALYNLYAVLPQPNIRNTNSYPMMDAATPAALPLADIALIPLLVAMRPETALAFLEFRWKHMDEARHRAESHGLSGAQISDSSVVKAHQNALDVSKSAMISISAWSCYRLLRNRDWLRAKGYEMIRDIADFLAAIVIEEDDGSMSSRCTKSLSGKESHENSFTNRVIVLAMKAAIESSWEMNLAPDEKWIAIFHSLKLERFENKVVKFDGDTCKKQHHLDILEPLLLMLPFYCNEVDPVSSKRMHRHYRDSHYMHKSDWTSMNVALKAITAGRAAQQDAIFLEDFEKDLAEFVSRTAGRRWGSLLSARNSSLPDPISSALLVSIFVHGVAGLKVEGGVSETRFYYEEMRLNSAITANLPRYWDKIVIQGVGAKQSQEFRTLNNVLID